MIGLLIWFEWAVNTIPVCWFSSTFHPGKVDRYVCIFSCSLSLVLNIWEPSICSKYYTLGPLFAGMSSLLLPTQKYYGSWLRLYTFHATLIFGLLIIVPCCKQLKKIGQYKKIVFNKDHFLVSRLLCQRFRQTPVPLARSWNMLARNASWWNGESFMSKYSTANVRSFEVRL